MNNDDIAQLTILLDNGLSPDQATRENSEKILLQSATTNPSQMVEILIEIIRSSPKANDRARIEEPCKEERLRVAPEDPQQLPVQPSGALL